MGSGIYNHLFSGTPWSPTGPAHQNYAPWELPSRLMDAYRGGNVPQAPPQMMAPQPRIMAPPPQQQVAPQLTAPSATTAAAGGTAVNCTYCSVKSAEQK
jgi:hypothetical protein